MYRCLTIFVIIISLSITSSCSLIRKSAQSIHGLLDVSYDFDDKMTIDADVLLNRQETKSSKVYVIEGTVDLRNKYIILPYGSTLVFKKGKLINGHIIGCETSIIDLYFHVTLNCLVHGISKRRIQNGSNTIAMI